MNTIQKSDNGKFYKLWKYIAEYPEYMNREIKINSNWTTVTIDDTEPVILVWNVYENNWTL